MRKIDIAFVILNFYSSDELFNCVSSIEKNCSKEDWVAVIVDNGSNSMERECLKKQYSNNLNIKLIFTDRNLGFAQGNNVGFRYIKNNFDCKYIAMINSDTLLTEDNFFLEIEECYKMYHFAVLGPDILYSHDNPMKNQLDNYLAVVEEIKKVKNIILILKIPVVNYIFLILKRLFAKSHSSFDNTVVVNCQLHGCFLIFSKLFTLDGLCNETFLYGEEAILFKDCSDHGLKMVYNPRIKIIHNESISTKKVVPKRIQRKLFFYNHYLDSLDVLLRKYQES